MFQLANIKTSRYHVRISMNLDYTVWEVMRDVREKESDGTTGKTVSNDWRKN